ncbi:hypothetical protein fugu_000671 [Takifugu bimaculatus]|uniref:glutaminase n=1 Tax=Takifugu bimaculatus TaxID=433685 RepID=A0A4Z2CHD4_9TELE|nr:hypothetical protein fugu_000671 [Takifugu bimaculatus]
MRLLPTRPERSTAERSKNPPQKYQNALKATGLSTGDPRLKECMETLKESLKNTEDGLTLDRELFKKCVQSNIILLTQAFRKKFVIPDFQAFTSHIDELYENSKSLSGGQVADYIPQLAKFSPELWSVSLCTVDGQRHTIGDSKVPFCLQSCVKPLKYAIAVNDHGTEYVHSFIGKEPSGLRFNKLFLNEEDKPHNPMVNAGAIVCTSLIKQGEGNADKFDYLMNFLKKMAGNEYVGFSNATFQSERESGDRNFAIGYYLKEKKCFPEGTDMTSVLDLYFQLCSIEVTCESASVMAATLANGGFCPMTGERVLSPEAVRNTLSPHALLRHVRLLGTVCFPRRSPSQVWSIGGDPVGRAQCDGDRVLVTATGQAGELSPRDTVLHGFGGTLQFPQLRQLEALCQEIRPSQRRRGAAGQVCH